MPSKLASSPFEGHYLYRTDLNRASQTSKEKFHFLHFNVIDGRMNASNSFPIFKTLKDFFEHQRLLELLDEICKLFGK